MRKLFAYVNETGAMAIIGAIERPVESFESIRNVFALTLEHEKAIRR